MITKQWLAEQVEVLSGLVVEAEKEFQEAKREFLCAKVKLKSAESRVADLKAVEKELALQLSQLGLAVEDDRSA